MIDRRLQLMLLLNCHPCCAVCFSERIDDLCDAVEAGAAFFRYDNGEATGIFLTPIGAELATDYPMVAEAVA